MKLCAGVRVVLLGAGLSIAQGTWADSGFETVQHPDIGPEATVVLLLPPVDATIDAGKLAPLRQRIARLEMEYQFIVRRFNVMGDQMAAEAARQSPAVDLGGAAGPSEQAMNELARRTRAHLIVEVVVREITSVTSTAAEFQARSTIDLRIWDARSEKWRFSGACQGFSDGGGPPGWLFIESLRDAVQKGLASSLQQYPEIAQVSRNGAIVDYLAGQTTPFVWRGSGAFEGLKEMHAP